MSHQVNKPARPNSESSVTQVNKAVHVNVHMFVPVIVLGAITGLGGALYNRLCLKAAAFRGKHIKPRPIFFLLEPVLVTVSVHAAPILPP